MFCFFLLNCNGTRFFPFQFSRVVAKTKPINHEIAKTEERWNFGKIPNEWHIQRKKESRRKCLSLCCRLPYLVTINLSFRFSLLRFARERKNLLLDAVEGMWYEKDTIDCSSRYLGKNQRMRRFTPCYFHDVEISGKSYTVNGSYTSLMFCSIFRP